MEPPDAILTRPFSRAHSHAPILTRPFSRAHSHAPILTRLSHSLALLLLTATLCHADALPWNNAKQGKFVTAFCADHQGRTVIATEDQGLWRWNPAIRQYDHFTTKDGLASDDVYALATDARGRLFAGTLRGLSVYNGKAWKTYGPLEGVGGWRTFALAVCPTDGDIWIAAEGGLTRYSLHGGGWTQYSRLDGLPSDALSCLAFKDNGDLYVGTQADGIAFASRADGYKHWRVTRGPSQMPATNAGAGLPTSLINALLVTHDGTVYAGTDTGLARSGDGGDTWRFLRGDDWEAMVKGLYHGPAPVKADTHGLSLLEDYVTCLVGDGHGHLLIGHRQRGVEVASLKTGARLSPGPTDKQPTDYVTALLPLPDGTCLVGGYGGGLTQTPLPDFPPVTAAPPATIASAPQAFPPLPAPAPPPTLAELNAMLKVVSAVPPDPNEMQPKAVALADDWVTQGDWLGRYGRYWACLCAICAPSDYQWGAGWQPINYISQMGPNHDPGDSLRSWVQWLYTADPRVLEMPPTYLDSRIKKGLTDGSKPRREAEQDDHSEVSPMTRDSGGVFETVTVPAGLFYLSLYDMNKDGHSDTNRFRDYRLSVRPHPAGTALDDLGAFADQPEWAHGRVVGFWGGVWKRFLVRGPVTLTVAVGRNHSKNTILPAVTLDLVDEEPPPYFKTVAQWEAEQGRWLRERRGLAASWRASGGAVPFHSSATAGEAAARLLASLDRARLVNSAWWAASGRRFYGPLLRWYTAQLASPNPAVRGRLLVGEETCVYALGLYPDWEWCQRTRGLRTARDLEKALKWDGVSDAGDDYRVVSDYLAGQRNRRLGSQTEVPLRQSDLATTPARVATRPGAWRN